MGAVEHHDQWGRTMRDWKNFVDHFDTMTCVLSVEKKPDGTCGTVRIVTGNQKYLDSLELAGGSVDVGSEKKVEFVPGSGTGGRTFLFRV